MSDSNATTPYRIEWKGPEGFGVILDEDGINLSKDGRPVLEQCDLNELLAVIEEARRVKDANACPVAPARPPPSSAATTPAPTTPPAPSMPSCAHSTPSSTPPTPRSERTASP